MPVSRETRSIDDSSGQQFRTLISERVPDCSETQLDRLAVFAQQILDENQLLHLVSQRDPRNEILKQIVDSSSIARKMSFCPGCRLLDVGSGAGFPGIVLKILFEKIELLTLDSSPRKISFQKAVCSKLGIDASFLCGDFRRLEIDIPVDVVIVKALGNHSEVIRKSRVWLRNFGLLVFMEGRTPDPMLESSVRKSSAFSHVTFEPYDLGDYGIRRHLAIVYKR